MTPLEYVEVLAVEQAIHAAREFVRNSSTCKGLGHWCDHNGKAYFLSDKMNFKRYIRYLGEQLCFRGIDGVRLGA